MPDDTQDQNTPVQPTTSDVPNQLPDPSQQKPSLFQAAMANAVQQQQNQPQQTQPQPAVTANAETGGPQVQGPNGSPQPLFHDKGSPDNTDRRDFHPQVQHASVLRKVAETLAGGEQTVTKIDPDTGEATRVKKPLTNSQILLGAIANVLSVGSQLSRNIGAGMLHQPMQGPQPLPTQVQQQQQAQQSEDDFNREQTQKVRRAKILESNMNTMRLSYALRHEDEDSLKQIVANSSSDLDNWNRAGVVTASNVPSSEVLQRGYDKARFLAVPDGVLPVHSQDGSPVMTKAGIPASELSYSIIDGTTQAPLSQEAFDRFANYGLMQQKPGFKLPEGASISSAQLALMNSKVGLVQQTQDEMDRLHDAVGGNKVDLAAEIRKNPKVLSAIEQFHSTNPTEDDPVKLLQAMATSNNQKTRNATGVMSSLFGQKNLDKWIARTQKPPDHMSIEDARQIQADPNTDPLSDAGKTSKAVLAGVKQDEIDKENRKAQADADRDQNKQNMKDRSTMGYVEDQSGKTYYVSKYDSANNPQYSAQSFNEVKPSDVAKDKAVIRPLSDVQMNLNHYRTATNGYDAAVQNGRITPQQAKTDRDNLTTIFSAPAVTDAASAHAGVQGFGISIPSVAADLNAKLATKVTNAYNGLSPEGKSMADNYVRARAAIPAWVKALTNSGRGSKEQLDIELQNLLPPYYGTSDIHNRLDGFQDNLDNQKSTLPQNLLGNAIPQAVTRGAQQQQRGGITVTDPRGVVHTFPDQKSADNFKQLAGIK